MAKYVFHADLYPNGTTLADLGVTNAATYIATEIGATGRKYWRMGGNTFNGIPLLPDAYTDYEILLLSNLTPTENNTAFLNSFVRLDSSTSASIIGYHLPTSGSTTTYKPSTGYMTTSKDLTPAIINSSTAIAMRFSFSASQNVTTKVWTASVDGLEAAEPATTTLEGSLVASGAKVPGLWFASSNSFFRPTSYTTISIGTDGDAAPYPQAGQTVTAPSGLAVSNITAETADVDWT